MDFFGDDCDEDDVNIALSSPKDQFVCEIRSLSGIGGGRGIFAGTDIEAGTLVLAEVPIIRWETLILTDLSALYEAMECILSNEIAIEATRYLHPRKISDADEEEVSNARSLIDDGDFNEIISRFEISNDEIVRIYLVLQHNAFASGLYKYLCLFNHSCFPNCIKFAPKPSSNGASEIWTTRKISKDEELLICYCETTESTSKIMGEFLKQNHRFDCVCTRCRDNSIVDVDRDEYHVGYESGWLQELDAIESEMKWLAIDEEFDQFKTFLRIRKALKIRFENYDLILSDAHQNCSCTLLYCRSLRDIVNATIQCIDFVEKHSKDRHMIAKCRKKLGDDFQDELLVDYAVYSYQLLESERLTLGVDHPFLATTHDDVFNALNGLLKCHLHLLPALHDRLNLNWTESKPFVIKQSKFHQTEAKRLKNLYSPRLRYPWVYQGVSSPGSFHWNGAINDLSTCISSVTK